MTRKYGVSYSSIYRILSRQGINFKGEHNSRKDVITKEVQLGELSQSEIARKYNVSRQYVSLIKKEMEANKNENLAL